MNPNGVINEVNDSEQVERSDTRKRTERGSPNSAVRD